eukprot:scaffold156711_cov73-Attheya_sp.AAC.1
MQGLTRSFKPNRLRPGRLPWMFVPSASVQKAVHHATGGHFQCHINIPRPQRYYNLFGDALLEVLDRDTGWASGIGLVPILVVSDVSRMSRCALWRRQVGAFLNWVVVRVGSVAPFAAAAPWAGAGGL